MYADICRGDIFMDLVSALLLVMCTIGAFQSRRDAVSRGGDVNFGTYITNRWMVERMNYL